MADTPEAPAPTPAGESVATPNTPETTAAPQTPDMHGFTSEQLADMKKFFDNNGGFDGVKAKISNPGKPAEAPVEAPKTAPELKNDTQPTPPQAQPVALKIPEGALSQRDVDIKRYFKDLSEEPAYANISKEIANGDYLKEMTDLGIQIEVAPGFYNDDRIRKYLSIKSQTVPAKPTGTEPDASSAPTVDYVAVGDKIENIDQAYAVLMQHSHPRRQDAMEFIKAHLNPGYQPEKK